MLNLNAFFFQQKLQRRKKRRLKTSEDFFWPWWLFFQLWFFIKFWFYLCGQEKERTPSADWSTNNSCYWSFPIWRFSWRWNSAVQRWVSWWWINFSNIWHFPSIFDLNLSKWIMFPCFSLLFDFLNSQRKNKDIS